MKGFYLFLFLSLGALQVIAQAPVNDNITGAITLTDVTDYCSGDGAYSSINATPSGYGPGSSWNTSGNDVWFKLTALRSDLTVTVTGSAAGSSNTLQTPLVAIYEYNSSTGVLTEGNVSMTRANNQTTAYRGALTTGSTYYIRVSAENNSTGTFRLCVDNSNPPVLPGQDCASATKLCNKEPIAVSRVDGRGSVQETFSNDYLGPETNSSWYTWTAATDGTLTFRITPNDNVSDIDWGLFDAGPAGNCGTFSKLTPLRSASGLGVGCPNPYHVTGMDLTDGDEHEFQDCVEGQNGFVRFINMQAGHVYYLYVDNVNSKAGFKIEFGGTGEFLGPQAPITVQKNNECTPGQTFTFSTTPDALTASVKWSFGEAGDASLLSAAGNGPYTLSYATPGTKTIVLEATSAAGCSTISTYSLGVGLKPSTPTVSAPNPNICTGQDLVLTASAIPNVTYVWSGPNNYSGTGQTVTIRATSTQFNGTYTVYAVSNGCNSDPASITISNILDQPVAAFTTTPSVPAQLGYPVEVNFTNRSAHADNWLWDFGDGSTSTNKDPVHTYTQRGDYSVKLTVSNANNCSSDVTKGTFVIRAPNTLFIPNAFTPNGDGVNDEFVITMINMTNYRLSIFNRFGTVLYQTANIFETWNGRYDGADLPFGVYYYLLTATDSFGKKITRSGSVTLIR